MSEGLFVIDTKKLRTDLIRALITELEKEFSSIIPLLSQNLDLSKDITELPSSWIEDVKDYLKYSVKDDTLTDTICGVIGVFSTDNGMVAERPKDILWKAMILNYGMGLRIRDNEYLDEYTASNDFSAIRKSYNPPYNITTRHDSYYDPNIKGYVPADTLNKKKDKVLPQFSHNGSAWWSDIYAKFLDIDGRALVMIEDIVNRVENNMNWESYCGLNECLKINL